MIYLNLKTSKGIETIDQLERNDFDSFKEYKIELKNMIINYRLAGMNVYKSQRACKDWE
jgi:hypothetical protein